MGGDSSCMRCHKWYIPFRILCVHQLRPVYDMPLNSDCMTPYIIIRYKYRVVQVLTDDTFNLGPNNRYCKIQVQPTHSIFYDASKTLVANIAFGHTYTKIPNNIIGSQINQNLFRVNWFKRATEPHKIALQASCLIFTDIFLLLLIRIQLLWDISFGNISIFFISE